MIEFATITISGLFFYILDIELDKEELRVS